MSTARGSPELDFELVGGRGYVRATDVLRELVQILPSQNIAICFRKPLRGPAALVQGHDSAARATVRLEDGERYSFVPLQRRAKRVASRPRSFSSFCLRFGALFVVFAGPGGTKVDQIESCFELASARLPQRFFVHTLIFHGPSARSWGLVWFRIRRSGNEARCVMRTMKGPLAELRFFVRRRNRPD